ncbi:MAG: hypothetical protein V1847_03075 [Candidatus Diapherotrites archaeon]
MRAGILFAGILAALLLFGCTQNSTPQISSFDVPSQINQGEALTVSISATGTELQKISASVGSNVQEFQCESANECSNEFSFPNLGSGNYSVQANAVDSKGQGASLSKTVEVVSGGGTALSEAEKILESYGFFGAENIGESSLNAQYFNQSGAQWVKVFAFKNSTPQYADPAIQWSEKKAFVVLSPSKYDANGGMMEAEWKAFVKEVVTKYSKAPYNAKLYQLVENPEYSKEWKDSAENYALLLRQTFEAVKNTDPNALVVLGSYVQNSADKNFDFPTRVIQYTYSDGMKGSDFFDVFAVDYYESTSQMKTRWKNIESKLQALGAPKPMILTSTGTNNSLLEEQSIAKDVVQRLTTARYLNILMTQWYSFRDNLNSVTEEQGLGEAGLVSEGGRMRTAYFAFQFLAGQLKDANLSQTEIVSEGKNSVYAYKFRKSDNSTVTIAWNYSSIYADLNYPTTSSSVQVWDLLADGSGVFSKTTVSASQGSAIVKVKENPIAIFDQ